MRRVSNQSKWMLGLSFGVSAALIVTVGLSAAAQLRHGAADAQWWFVIGMIVLAVVTFGLFAVFRLYRGRYAKMLSAPYFAVYEQVRDALNVSELSQAEKREVRMDVLEMLAAAQREGRDAADVTGGNAQAFVARVTAALGYRSSAVFNVCGSVQFAVVLLTFLQAIVYFRAGGAVPFFESGLALQMLIMYGVLAFAVYPALRRMMRRQQAGRMAAVIVGYAVVFIGLIVLLDNAAGDVPWVRFLLDTDVAVISSWWMAIGLLAAAAAAQAIKLILRRRAIRRL